MRVLRRIPEATVIDEADDCTCPACAGAVADPRQTADDILAITAGLADSDDAVLAELVGATLVSLAAKPGEPPDVAEDALVTGYIPDFEARGTAEALAALLAIRAVAPDRAGKAAAVAADRMVDTGVAAPAWAGELAAPLTASGCRRLADAAGSSVLACVFERAGQTHAMVIGVDDVDCGQASSIDLLAAEDLPHALALTRSAARNLGVELTTTGLRAAEFRWRVERALDARATHDRQRPVEERPGELVDGEGASYPALALLVRARMAALPVPDRLPAQHGAADDGPAEPVVPGTTGTRIYQLKIGLRGATPPIWRRVEVPADLALAELHAVVQAAFGWNGTHMYAFDTFLGEFGPDADAEVGHRSAASVRLARVAPGAKSRLRYTYDFGDDWEHEIVVERVLGRDPAIGYPRCTGGRRAAPPEDSGGIRAAEVSVGEFDLDAVNAELRTLH